MEKRGIKLRENGVFLLFLLGMAIYYGWRMFALVPWYDELYTYYYFISRGPVYAAIHWPLPNNHVGYSVLSACLTVFGSPAVALRGVSYLCSLFSLTLLYRIGKKRIKGAAALIPVFLFAGISIVNQLAVQGRGYALVTFCYLLAVYELQKMAEEEKERLSSYILFSGALLMALWAIPSSVYMVLPVCIAGGFYFLLSGKKKKLFHLILASLASAAGTAFLYGLLWLAIGSNLLAKTEGSLYYGMGHFQILRKAPIQALREGIDYMLASPYIQSVPREGFLARFAAWLQTLLGTQYRYLSFWGSLLFWIAVVAATCLLCLFFLIRGYRRVGRKFRPGFFAIFFLISALMLPGMLIAQCKLPYYRVFSFAAALLGLMSGQLVVWVQESRLLSDRTGRIARTAGTVLAFLLCVAAIGRGSGQYSHRDAMLADVYRNMPAAQTEKIAVTDCDQEYLLLYQLGIDGERTTRALEEADWVVLDKYLLGTEGYADKQEEPELWKLYLAREEVPAEYLEGSMTPFYENDYFVLFQKKK